jgi:hypothetical protein
MAEFELYDALASTAESFILSCRPLDPGSNKLNRDSILQYFAPDFQVGWAHDHFITTVPPLQGSKNGTEWLDFMAASTSRLETWDIQISSTIVDVRQRKVMVRAKFFMTVEKFDPVCDDVVVVMGMDQEGKKLVECLEFPDPIAMQEIARRLALSSQ